jgi:hypothetical protein
MATCKSNKLCQLVPCTRQYSRQLVVELEVVLSALNEAEVASKFWPFMLHPICPPWALAVMLSLEQLRPVRAASKARGRAFRHQALLPWAAACSAADRRGALNRPRAHSRESPHR